MQTIPIEWKYQGCLSDDLKNDRNGTYVFIYNGPIRRIFYVGTATRRSFSTRWAEHRGHYLDGLYTLWRIPKHEDIYEYMSCGIKTGNNMRDYYREQANRNPPIMWGGSQIDIQPRVNDLNDTDLWSDTWRADACEFVKRLEVWACVLDNEKISLLLESQLIYTLKTHFLIGYTDFKLFKRCSRSSSLLGQQQDGLGQLNGLEFEFKSFPDCDENTHSVLRGMKEQKWGI